MIIKGIHQLGNNHHLQGMGNQIKIPDTAETSQDNFRWATLFKTFVKIGAFTLGGGYAMIPIIEAEVVDRHKWIDKDEFLNLIAIAQSCPGVFAVNISIFIGYKLRATRGAVCTAMGASLPSFLIILLIAMFFHSFMEVPWIAAMFSGIRPAVDGSVIAMSRALAMAGLSVDDIDYINAHATSTHQGDMYEAIALNRMFEGKHALISSTKSMTGHECWMAGASEIVYSTLMMQDNFVAPNINFENPDEYSSKLNIAAKTIDTEVNTVLSNSFGFGGTNSALIIKKIK